MPVRKFRTVEELNQPVWRDVGDPMLYRTIAAVWATGRRVRTRVFPPGVRRFHSIDELEAAADEPGA